MKRRRVKITGIGPVTPAGVGREAFWKGILEPVSRIRPFEELDREDGILSAGYIPGFDAGLYLDTASIPKGSGRHAQFAAVGSILALQDAGIDPIDLDPAVMLIAVGSSLLDFGSIGAAIQSVSKRGMKGAHPRVVYTANGASTANVINAVLKTAARTMSTQNSCCSGLDAIGYAAGMIASGEVDLAICGGTEAPLHRFPVLELRAAGLTPSNVEMAERLVRPFDLWRTTGVISEGACMLVLEPDESPRRGYCEFRGYAFANDSDRELCGGLVVAARQAIASAGVRPDDIDAINAWGPGHKLIDHAEVLALLQIFGKRLLEIPSVSIKGSIGNALGAAGAIQVAAAALGLRDSIVPPTVNWEFPDPSCPLALANRARQLWHNLTLINAHGVGAVNSCVVLRGGRS